MMHHDPPPPLDMPEGSEAIVRTRSEARRRIKAGRKRRFAPQPADLVVRPARINPDLFTPVLHAYSHAQHQYTNPQRALSPLHGSVGSPTGKLLRMGGSRGSLKAAQTPVTVGKAYIDRSLFKPKSSEDRYRKVLAASGELPPPRVPSAKRSRHGEPNPHAPAEAAQKILAGLRGQITQGAGLVQRNPDGTPSVTLGPQPTRTSSAGNVGPLGAASPSARSVPGPRSSSAKLRSIANMYAAGPTASPKPAAPAGMRPGSAPRTVRLARSIAKLRELINKGAPLGTLRSELQAFLLGDLLAGGEVDVVLLDELLGLLQHQQPALQLTAAGIFLQRGLYFSAIRAVFTGESVIGAVLEEARATVAARHEADDDLDLASEAWNWDHADRQLFLRQFAQLRIVQNFRNLREKLTTMGPTGEAALGRVERQIILKVVNDFLEQLGPTGHEQADVAARLLAESKPPATAMEAQQASRAAREGAEEPAADAKQRQAEERRARVQQRKIDEQRQKQEAKRRAVAARRAAQEANLRERYEQEVADAQRRGVREAVHKKRIGEAKKETRRAKQDLREARGHQRTGKLPEEYRPAVAGSPPHRGPLGATGRSAEDDVAAREEYLAFLQEATAAAEQRAVAQHAAKEELRRQREAEAAAAREERRRREAEAEAREAARQQELAAETAAKEEAAAARRAQRERERALERQDSHSGMEHAVEDMSSPDALGPSMVAPGLESVAEAPAVEELQEEEAQIEDQKLLRELSQHVSRSSMSLRDIGGHVAAGEVDDEVAEVLQTAARGALEREAFEEGGRREVGAGAEEAATSEAQLPAAEASQASQMSAGGAVELLQGLGQAALIREAIPSSEEPSAADVGAPPQSVEAPAAAEAAAEGSDDEEDDPFVDLLQALARSAIDREDLKPVSDSMPAPGDAMYVAVAGEVAAEAASRAEEAAATLARAEERLGEHRAKSAREASQVEATPAAAESDTRDADVLVQQLARGLLDREAIAESIAGAQAALEQQSRASDAPASEAAVPEPEASMSGASVAAPEEQRSGSDVSAPAAAVAATATAAAVATSAEVLVQQLSRSALDREAIAESIAGAQAAPEQQRSASDVASAAPLPAAAASGASEGSQVERDDAAALTDEEAQAEALRAELERERQELLAKLGEETGAELLSPGAEAASRAVPAVAADGEAAAAPAHDDTPVAGEPVPAAEVADGASAEPELVEARGSGTVATPERQASAVGVGGAHVAAAAGVAAATAAATDAQAPAAGTEATVAPPAAAVAEVPAPEQPEEGVAASAAEVAPAAGDVAVEQPAAGSPAASTQSAGAEQHEAPRSDGAASEGAAPAAAAAEAAPAVAEGASDVAAPAVDAAASVEATASAEPAAAAAVPPAPVDTSAGEPAAAETVAAAPPAEATTPVPAAEETTPAPAAAETPAAPTGEAAPVPAEGGAAEAPQGLFTAVSTSRGGSSRVSRSQSRRAASSARSRTAAEEAPAAPADPEAEAAALERERDELLAKLAGGDAAPAPDGEQAEELLDQLASLSHHEPADLDSAVDEVAAAAVGGAVAGLTPVHTESTASRRNIPAEPERASGMEVSVEGGRVAEVAQEQDGAAPAVRESAEEAPAVHDEPAAASAAVEGTPEAPAAAAEQAAAEAPETAAEAAPETAGEAAQPGAGAASAQEPAAVQEEPRASDAAGKQPEAAAAPPDDGRGGDVLQRILGYSAENEATAKQRIDEASSPTRAGPSGEVRVSDTEQGESAREVPAAALQARDDARAGGAPATPDEGPRGAGVAATPTTMASQPAHAAAIWTARQEEDDSKGGAGGMEESITSLKQRLAAERQKMLDLLAQKKADLAEKRRQREAEAAERQKSTAAALAGSATERAFDGASLGATGKSVADSLGATGGSRGASALDAPDPDEAIREMRAEMDRKRNEQIEALKKKRAEAEARLREEREKLEKQAAERREQLQALQAQQTARREALGAASTQKDAPPAAAASQGSSTPSGTPAAAATPAVASTPAAATPAPAAAAATPAATEPPAQTSAIQAALESFQQQLQQSQQQMAMMMHQMSTMTGRGGSQNERAPQGLVGAPEIQAVPMAGMQPAPVAANSRVFGGAATSYASQGRAGPMSQPPQAEMVYGAAPARSADPFMVVQAASQFAAGPNAGPEADAPTPEEIAEYAAYLGMDPVADADLLYIAEWAITAPLPDGWTEHYDAEGNEFYYNTLTGVSTYEHPMDEQFRSYYRNIKAQRTGQSLEDSLRQQLAESAERGVHAQ